MVGTRGAFVAAVATALVLGAGPRVSAQTKEGTFKGAYYGYGTAKATLVGEEQFLALEENGLQLTDGFFDHTTLHCWGLAEFANGSGEGAKPSGLAGEVHGYCVGVDPAGDQFAFNFETEKHAPNQKSFKGSSTMTTGTGKYRGIIGGSEFVVHSNEFRPMAEGTFVNYVTFQGHYKLP
jgi:hypothetical protein